jgi:hypothetical protein
MAMFNVPAVVNFVGELLISLAASGKSQESSGICGDSA